MASYLSSWWSGKSSEVATTDAKSSEQEEGTSSNSQQDETQASTKGQSVNVQSVTIETPNTREVSKPASSAGAGPSRPKDTFKVPALPTRSLAPNQSVASSSSLVPPPIPSRQGPAPTFARPRIQEPEDIDAAPQFPLPDSAQRSRPAPPSFDIDIRPPSPVQEDEDEPPSDLNIAILPGTVPLGNMAPPPSTTAKPAFGMQNGAPVSKAKRREKVALGPGYSPLDWARLTQSGRNLRGVEGPKRVTLEELAKHNDQYDAWMALDGIVYNITPYVRFHPGGGKELLRGAGRDGTKLFMNTHSWVNYTHMLQECIVGPLVRK